MPLQSQDCFTRRRYKMPLPRVRNLECPLPDATLQNLIAVYLSNMGVIRFNEEITDLELTAPDKKGVRTIKFRMEPLTQTIHHG